MRWLHFRPRLVGTHNPARCLRRGCGSESRPRPGGDVEGGPDCEAPTRRKSRRSTRTLVSCCDACRNAVFLEAGLEVRIRLPPAESQGRTCLSREFAFLGREAAV